MVQISKPRTDRFDEILAAARDGHEWAWESLYRGLAGPVVGYVASRGAKDAEDVASEVFLQVARDIEHFEGGEASFRSWVFVIAHRRLIDARRALARSPEIADDFDVASTDLLGGNVEVEAFEQLSNQHLRKVLDSLTDDQRHVLALRVVADLSLRETAQVMSKRVGAIKALQRRALQTVRQQIENGEVSL